MRIPSFHSVTFVEPRGSHECDRADPVPNEVWKEAVRNYSENQLGALVMSIGLINLYNRLHTATRQPTGDFVQQIVERYI